MSKAPVFFISHGAPSFALEPDRLGPLLTALGSELTDIQAVLVLSPHWQTRGIRVMTTAAPTTLHDFGGFAEALYQLQYPVPGAPELAIATADLLAAASFPVSLDDQRGLDHGAWVPLLHLLPDRHLPVFQVSLPTDLSAAGAFRLGQVLAPLRERGVLIIGSGSLTHNLYEFRQHGAEAAYARVFTEWTRAAVQTRASDALLGYREQAPHAVRAHPTEEHFLPLLIALGASDQNDELTVIDGGIQHGVLSMESYRWQAAAAPN